MLSKNLGKTFFKKRSESPPPQKPNPDETIHELREKLQAVTATAAHNKALLVEQMDVVERARESSHQYQKSAQRIQLLEHHLGMAACVIEHAHLNHNKAQVLEDNVWEQKYASLLAECQLDPEESETRRYLRLALDRFLKNPENTEIVSILKEDTSLSGVEDLRRELESKSRLLHDLEWVVQGQEEDIKELRAKVEAAEQRAAMREMALCAEDELAKDRLAIKFQECEAKFRQLRDQLSKKEAALETYVNLCRKMGHEHQVQLNQAMNREYQLKMALESQEAQFRQDLQKVVETTHAEYHRRLREIETHR